jgi:hypothetical protein
LVANLVFATKFKDLDDGSKSRVYT